MSSIAMAGIVFVCLVGAALLAMRLGRALPEQHLSGDSRDVVKLGLALIATLSALVLGLLVAATKGAYDRQASAVKQMAANVLLLDRLLARYGPETKEARELHRLLDARDHRVFAGALDRDKVEGSDLSRLERAITRRFIPEGDWRDWDAIDRWADEIASSLLGTSAARGVAV